MVTPVVLKAVMKIHEESSRCGSFVNSVFIRRQSELFSHNDSAKTEKTDSARRDILFFSQIISVKLVL
jgi:hypothetical protein